MGRSERPIRPPSSILLTIKASRLEANVVVNLNALVAVLVVWQAPARQGLRALPAEDSTPRPGLSVAGMVGRVTPVTAVVASRNA